MNVINKWKLIDLFRKSQEETKNATHFLAKEITEANRDFRWRESDFATLMMWYQARIFIKEGNMAKGSML